MVNRNFEDMSKAISILFFIEPIKEAMRDVMKEFKATENGISKNEVVRKPITTKELCEFLGVTGQTIIRWKKKGKIPFFRIGSAVRFDLDKVLKALEEK